MYLNKIKTQNFRNFKELSLEFPEEGAFFSGVNGSGKTNILESIYMLCTGRSQRNAAKSDMVNLSALISSIEGHFTSESPGIIKNSRIVFNRNSIVEMSVNEKKINSFSDWFGFQTIVSFSPDDIEIIYGGPELRRKFLDILISLFDKDYFRSLIEYRKNLTLKNFLLKTKMDNILCDIYDDKLAEFSAFIVQKRNEILMLLAKEFNAGYREICVEKDICTLEYKPSFLSDLSSKKTWKEVFYSMLGERRKKDIEIGFSSKGPHRDDILFFINGKPADTFASRGQSRSIVLALKTGSVRCIEKNTGKKPIILFDDAVSELDKGRTERVYSLIEKQGQLFIASPGKSIPVKDKIKGYIVSEGTIVAQ